MSNVVQFLEALARSTKPLSNDELAAAVANAALEPTTKQALLDRDAIRLNEALGGRLNVMCLIVPAENDEPQESEDKDGEGESPEHETSSQAA